MSGSRGGRAPRKLRGFQLRILPSGADGFGVVIEETSSDSRKAPAVVARASPANVRRVMPSLMDAVRTSGHAKNVLSAQRAKPVPLAEEAGVRLALVLLATGPVRRWRRVDAMLEAVDGMTAEEAYYWYAKCAGAETMRVRRALRLLLAG